MSRRKASIAGMARALVAMVLLICVNVSQAADTQPAAANRQPGKTVRLLAIGNSFSQNATAYLPQLVESQGNTLIFGHASVGGCSLERHWGFVQKNEADPKDPAGRPYYMKGADGKQHSGASLKQLLQSQTWDIVTIQQHSWTSTDLRTYRPYAKQLTDYVRQHAPQAKIWVHETWAYRADDRLMKKTGTTQEKMYRGLHDAYTTIATEVAADKIIPVGTAFQNARQDPRWQLDVPKDFDPQTMKYPEVPRQVHSLCLGWRWDKKEQPPVLGYDGKHCTAAGKYLGALVWYETLYGAFGTAPFVPAELPPQDATFLQEIARKTVREGLQPRGLVAATKPAPTKH